VPSDAGLAYEVPGPLTGFDDDLGRHLAALPVDPVDICRVVQSLVVLPELASTVGMPEERHGERNIRPASRLLSRLQELDATPVQEPRPPAHRVVGTCRHFAVLACAFLRHRGVPARARCGFATYFVPGKYVDHWIVEHWRPSDNRWVRVDAEVLDLGVVVRPDDLADGEFLTGGEAWKRLTEERPGPTSTSSWTSSARCARPTTGCAFAISIALKSSKCLPR